MGSLVACGFVFILCNFCAISTSAFRKRDMVIETLNEILHAQNEIINSNNEIKTRLGAIESQLNIHFQARVSNITSAEEFTDLSDPTEIPKIIEQMYNNTEENFQVILNIAQELKQIELSYTVLSSLNNEMQKNGHHNMSNLMLLDKAIKAKEMNPNCPHDILLGINRIKYVIESTIGIAAVKELRALIHLDGYENIKRLQAFTSSLYDFNKYLSHEVIRGLLDTFYGNVKTEQILGDILKLKNDALLGTGIISLFGAMKDSKERNSPIVLRLALELKLLLKRVADDPNSVVDVTDIQMTIGALPTCVKNLYFDESFCLWNKAARTYAQTNASNVYEDPEHHRHKLFLRTPTPENDFPKICWNANEVDGTFLIRNSIFPTEYLHMEKDEHSYYAIECSTAECNDTKDQSRFQIELHGDYCYLKSAYFKNYLFASIQEHGHWDLLAGLLPKAKHTEFLWQIRECV